jgi:hypothetical protein
MGQRGRIASGSRISVWVKCCIVMQFTHTDIVDRRSTPGKGSGSATERITGLPAAVSAVASGSGSRLASAPAPAFKVRCPPVPTAVVAPGYEAAPARVLASDHADGKRKEKLKFRDHDTK